MSFLLGQKSPKLFKKNVCLYWWCTWIVRYLIVDFRQNVEALNKWCCPLYAHHEVKTAGYKKKFQFQEMDKICPTRNANITDVTKKSKYEKHMKKLAAEKKKLEKEKKKHGKIQNENRTTSGEREEEDNKNKGPPPYMKRICNGEIFFIKEVPMIDMYIVLWHNELGNCGAARGRYRAYPNDQSYQTGSSGCRQDVRPL